MAFSSVSALIAVGVAVGSVGLARLRVRGVRILTICSLLPALVDVVVGILWLSSMGGNVAYATGIGWGGLTLMKLSLLPLGQAFSGCSYSGNPGHCRHDR